MRKRIRVMRLRRKGPMRALLTLPARDIGEVALERSLMPRLTLAD